MHAAFTTLHLTPATFWSLSLPEWRALTTSPRGPTLTRIDLEHLMQAHPD
ncbi:MAG: phage tail assembly chaperone [Alphaproteobacteria bacterium]|nr:phage tail assembly chaperone [Alphaproteobacteria bacterium]MBL6938816.1 phage tail assembly chaperone [Alphaproteobacteria bacterium]MBL7097827.1 phage tail assembly chaperone [Alphaproteobacteria bacterium]